MSKSVTLSQEQIVKKLSASRRVVKSWSDLHDLFEKDSSWIYRGVGDPEHYPLPSIGREVVFGPYKLAQEVRLFSEFKKRAVALISDARFDDWAWLAYAQHIGVPTRLLDWSTSPLVALFFALESDGSTDRAIYAIKYSQYVHEVHQVDSNPLKSKMEGRFSAPLIFDRIRLQRGVFTIHPDPTRIFYHHTMRVIVIPKQLVNEFRKRLYKYGIDYWHIYPDMQGLGQQLKWQFKNKIGLGSVFVGK